MKLIKEDYSGNTLPLVEFPNLKFKGNLQPERSFEYGRKKNPKKIAIYNLKLFLDCVINFTFKYQCKGQSVKDTILKNDFLKKCYKDLGYEATLKFCEDSTNASRLLAYHLLHQSEQSNLLGGSIEFPVKLNHVNDIIFRVVNINNNIR
jgi:hypothetical protein